MVKVGIVLNTVLKTVLEHLCKGLSLNKAAKTACGSGEGQFVRRLSLFELKEFVCNIYTSAILCSTIR